MFNTNLHEKSFWVPRKLGHRQRQALWTEKIFMINSVTVNYWKCIEISSDGLSNYVFKTLFNTFKGPSYSAWHYNPPLQGKPTDPIFCPIVDLDLEKCVADPLLSLTTFLCSAINSSCSCAAQQSQIVGADSCRGFYISGSLSPASTAHFDHVVQRLYYYALFVHTQLRHNTFDPVGFNSTAPNQKIHTSQCTTICWNKQSY